MNWKLKFQKSILNMTFQVLIKYLKGKSRENICQFILKNNNSLYLIENNSINNFKFILIIHFLLKEFTSKTINLFNN
jgi:hypothetical protein